MKNLKKYCWVLVLSIGFNNMLNAQNVVVPLWKTTIPGSIINDDYKEVEIFKEGILNNTSKVSNPTLSVFLPKETIATGTAVVICPGGGYSHLAINKEGYKVAQWFNTLGITAFVLKYRLPSDLIMQDKTIGPLQDAQEALRFVRRNAKKYSIDSDKIGIMGFSAGGHLASTLATHYNQNVYKVSDSTSAKPNFSILIYPVISMEEGTTHNGSKNNLLGEDASKEITVKYSNEKQVNAETPKTFLVHATDDGSVPVENSINYYLALKNNGVFAEMHLYQQGGHGFGLGVKSTSQFWAKDFENWLKINNLID